MWIAADYPHGEEYDKPHRYEKLLTDDATKIVGSVTQFYDDGPSYGATDFGRTGAQTTFEGAKATVEEMVKRGL